MTSKRITVRVLGTLALLGGGVAGEARAQLKADAILARVPAQAGVTVSTPTGADLAACKAEAMAWPAGQNGVSPKGVVVTDGAGKKLRQFIDTAGGAKYNIFSYFVDGVESYREVDSRATGKPDQFRWLGVNGGKWGMDLNGDGTIDEWFAISPEEVSQELFAAIATKNPARFQALLVKEDDLKKLALPAAESAKLKNRAEKAVQRLSATADGLKLSEKAKFVHTNFGAPQATPADTFGGRDDLLTHKSGTVLLDKGDGQSMELFQTGDLVLVGRAWKVIDGPGTGGSSNEDPNTGIAQVPKVIESDVAKLQEIKPPANADDMARYHAERAAILEVCVRKTTGSEQVPWLKQFIDALQGVVESDPGKKEAFESLKAWKGAIFDTKGANESKPYVLFRLISAEYAVKLKDAKGPDVMKTQTWYRDQLEAFVKDHDKAADAPEALMRLATASEFAGKDGEAAAKLWYEKLAKEHAEHPHAAKATGAVKRLTSEGQPFQIAGTTFDGAAINQAQLAGKPTIVFYWASWGGTGDDLKGLADIAKALGNKVNIVTVSLDEQSTKADALKALTAAGLQGAHLHAPGGLDGSPLATSYGIQMIPHIFLIDKDGKVANRNAQGGPGLKDDVERLVK